MNIEFKLATKEDVKKPSEVQNKSFHIEILPAYIKNKILQTISYVINILCRRYVK